MGQICQDQWCSVDCGKTLLNSLGGLMVSRIVRSNLLYIVHPVPFAMNVKCRNIQRPRLLCFCFPWPKKPAWTSLISQMAKKQTRWSKDVLTCISKWISGPGLPSEWMSSQTNPWETAIQQQCNNNVINTSHFHWFIRTHTALKHQMTFKRQEEHKLQEMTLPQSCLPSWSIHWVKEHSEGKKIPKQWYEPYFRFTSSSLT